MPQRVAIVGVGISKHKKQWPEHYLGEMCDLAVREAFEDANLMPKDLDAIVMGNMPMFESPQHPEMRLLPYFGSEMKPCFHITTAGTTGGTCVNAAMDCVASGMFDTVMILGFQKQSEIPQAGIAFSMAGDQLFSGAAGGARAVASVGIWATLAVAYMNNYPGSGREHFAMARLRCDRNACLNPKAHLQLGLKSIDEIMNSRMLMYPTTLLDMCPSSEGAVAMILTSEEKAKKITNKPVWAQDWTLVHMATVAGGSGSVISNWSFKEAARQLYTRNNITDPMKEITMAELYSPGSSAEIAFQEFFNLVPEGESWKMQEKGVFDLEGAFPINPSGGVIGKNAIGACGVDRVAEAARELRGDCGAYQITRKPHRAFCSSWGGISWTAAQLLTTTLDY